MCRNRRRLRPNPVTNPKTIRLRVTKTTKTKKQRRLRPKKNPRRTKIREEEEEEEEDEKVREIKDQFEGVGSAAIRITRRP